MAVTITTTGAAFRPVTALVNGSAATVTWSCTGFTSQNGTAPSFSFGSAATRTVTMTVTGGGGYADVTLFNLGYDNTVDVGHFMPPSGYAKSAESVSGISGVNTLTGLIYFLADHTALAVSIDFTGMAALQYVQCYGTDITGVTLTGCTALIRLQVEASNLATLDLNPVSGNLYDLRAAVQQGGTLTFATLTSPMAVEYHYCVRDQAVINSIPLSQLPVVQEYWTWNTGLSGTLAPRSSALTDLLSFSNGWTSASFSGQFPSANSTLNVGLCQLTSVDLTGCNGLTSIDVHGNNLSRGAVDTILTTVAGWGTSNGALYLNSNTSPGPAGLAAHDALTGRGWTVAIDTAGTFSRLFPSTSGPGSSGDSNSLITNGAGFKVTSAGLYLYGYYFWRADSAQSASASFALWQATGNGTGTYLGTSTKASTSSMVAGQWNYVPLPEPVPLTSGTPYKAVVGFTGTHPLTFNQFGGGDPYAAGITNGPLTAFSSGAFSGNPGSNPDPYGNPQMEFLLGSSSDPAVAYPNVAFEDLNLWLDVLVGPPPRSGLLMAGFL
jgi:hypothetical protein